MNRAKCAQPWPHGQAVKTPPFHGGNMGSSPVGVTTKTSEKQLFSLVFVLCRKVRALPRISNQNATAQSRDKTDSIGCKKTKFSSSLALFAAFSRSKNKKLFSVRRLAAFFFFVVAASQPLPLFRRRLRSFRDLVGFMQPVRSFPSARSLLYSQNIRPIKGVFLQTYTTVSFRRRRER